MLIIPSLPHSLNFMLHSASKLCTFEYPTLLFAATRSAFPSCDREPSAETRKYRNAFPSFCKLKLQQIMHSISRSFSALQIGERARRGRATEQQISTSGCEIGFEVLKRFFIASEQSFPSAEMLLLCYMYL